MNIKKILSLLLCATVLLSSIDLEARGGGGGGGGRGGGGMRGGGGSRGGGMRGGGMSRGGNRGGGANRGGANRGGNRGGNRGRGGYGRGGYGRGGYGRGGYGYGRGWGGWGWGLAGGMLLTAGTFALLSSANYGSPTTVNNIYEGNLPQEDGSWTFDQQFKDYIDKCSAGCKSENPDLTREQCARLCVNNLLDAQNKSGASNSEL